MNIRHLSRRAIVSLPRARTPTLLAIAVCIGLLPAVPALAATAPGQDALHSWQQQRLQMAAQRNELARDAAVAPRQQPPSSSPAPAPAMGRPGDVDSWRTEEFQRDWGLGAINAEHAYARGLTGQGVRLGVFDSGTGLDHPEFAGKDHRSLRIGDLLADGTRCTNTTRIAGPDACFASDGDQVQVTYVRFNDNVPEDIRQLILDGPYVQPGAGFLSHGTHVAGTVAANRDGSGTHGVAFGADLSVARLFFDAASEWRLTEQGYSVVSLGGIGPDASAFQDMYAQMNAQGVRALNHSWGLRQEPDTPQALDQAYADAGNREYLRNFADGSLNNGMIQVWAAGNTDAAISSPDKSPIAGLYATLPRAFAELEPYWLSVVNITPERVLSNRSMKCGLSANWCLAAPGTGIDSTIYGEGARVDADLLVDADGNLLLDVIERVPGYGYGLSSGTSMAAPHVTGALGLLFERFPYLDSAQVRDVLLTTATDLGEAGVDDVYGWGLVDLRKAIEGYGQLRVDTHVVMNQKAGGLKVWEGEAWDDWTNDIGGPGKLTKSGIGWLRLSGDNHFNGASVREGVLELDGVNALTAALDVDGGQFLLNGTLRGMTVNNNAGSSRVNSGGVLQDTGLNIHGGVVAFNGVQNGGSTFVGGNGMLQGVGRLGDTRVEGIIAPGNSIGTLTIDGNYVQTATGTYLAELAPGGRSDRLHVTGTAHLDGTLRALPEPGVYYLGEQFDFIRADGGIDGRFASTDFSAFSPFLRFTLGYAGSGARIDVGRGDLLASAAATPNQRAVASSADRLAIDQGLPRPLTQLFPQQVGAALDALSGELHAATPMLLVEGSRYLRDAALGRAAGGRVPDADEAAATAAWVQAIGGSTRLDGDGNAIRSDANSNGLLVGADHRFGNGWQLGALAGTGRTDLKQGGGRGARAQIGNAHLGAYVGQQWGVFALRAGLGYTRHSVDSTRQLGFAGFQDRLDARYRASTRQGFVEGAWRLGSADTGLEPYLQLASVAVKMQDITEQGGAAALRGNVPDTATRIGTAGLRFNHALNSRGQPQAALQVHGGVGYRRAWGDRDQAAALAWTGDDRFAVRGAAIAAQTVVAELGLSARLSPRNQLELGYNGQFGSQSRDHGLTARWSVQF